ncbi:MAG: flagellar biosynthesis protein FliQ [Candidatus Acidulodesulfobacterium ferriphilum]|jgi:flagellar biosynthetic protein FliQ|uniref:Flagellar biosynthetic protein FliQ n=1 Tax=Candidatus Acidulodesulfobacterium ferriphilum TaxID=2597223 RepID=A0A519BBC2_9DELT|nr:MAG: flagellar biosynthesis protein FliQ [Candidatus Acidulodesulfobacterium ferriphilum]
MSVAFVNFIIQKVIITVLYLSAPPLIASLAIGITISVFQAVTQLQDQTLTFVPKIIVVIIVLLIFGPWMLSILVDFTRVIFIHFPQYIRGGS